MSALLHDAARSSRSRPLTAQKMLICLLEPRLGCEFIPTAPNRDRSIYYWLVARKIYAKGTENALISLWSVCYSL